MNRKGFTLIELLVVIAIIGVLAGLLLPVLNKAKTTTMRAECKTTINQLSQALKGYEEVENGYPPTLDTGANTEGGTYRYRNNILVACLDGDTSTVTSGYGNNRRQYFEFKVQQLRDDAGAIDATSPVIYDSFIEPLWYRNFQRDNSALTAKVNDGNNPLHPWTNAIFFQSYQIYGKANYSGTTLDSAYEDGDKNIDKFRWLTNYCD